MCTFFLWQWGIDKFLESFHQLADHERLSLNLIVLVRSEVVDADTEKGCQLSEVLLGNYHFLVLAEHFGSVLRQWLIYLNCARAILCPAARSSSIAE